MHNREKYPAIWAEMEAAQKELDPLMEERKIHTDAMKDLQLKINALREQKEAMNDGAIKDSSRICELRDIISRMAKAMGAKTAS